MIDDMNRKIFLLFVLTNVFATTVSASTVKWLVMPKYDAIVHYNSSIFKCKTNGKWQLIDSKGTSLLPSTFDSITECTEGFALALDKENENYKIKGFFTESDHQFVPINGNYYTGVYSFFSEGYLPVADPTTKLFGYLNTEGDLVVPFRFQQARPFIKGLASVEPKERKTIYIDKSGKTLTISGFHHDKIIMGSSFNQNGEALIAYYDNDNAIINTNGVVVRKYKRKDGETPIRRHDFSFDDSGVPFYSKQEIPLAYDKSITTFSDNGLVGYIKDDNTLVPAQFTQAGDFANGHAIASINNKYGVLSLIEGDFSATLDGDSNVLKSGKEEPKFVYTLKLPESIAQLVEVKFDNGDGVLQDITLENNSYTFTPAVDKDAREVTIRAQVTLDCLLVWEDETTKSLNSIQLDIDQPFCDSDYADGNDIVRVKTIITNNSEIAVNVSTYFSPKFAKKSKNSMASKAYSSAKIAPGEKKEFFTDLKIIEAEKVKVSVSVKANGKHYVSKSSTLELKPFY